MGASATCTGPNLWKNESKSELERTAPERQRMPTWHEDGYAVAWAHTRVPQELKRSFPKHTSQEDAVRPLRTPSVCDMSRLPGLWSHSLLALIVSWLLWLRLGCVAGLSLFLASDLAHMPPGHRTTSTHQASSADMNRARLCAHRTVITPDLLSLQEGPSTCYILAAADAETPTRLRPPVSHLQSLDVGSHPNAAV